MAEYIDREAALNVVDFWASSRLQNIHLTAAVNDIPAADVVPVRHGQWIGFPNYCAVCSVCEECFSILGNDTERFDFCPHCGAKMDEDESEGE